MAGGSERFRNAGYTVPKAFMLIDGRPMIHWVCSMFSSSDEFIFIVRREHCEVPEYRAIIESAAVRHSIVSIEPNRQGPIVSILQANLEIAPDEPVIITYCDFYQHWNYPKFLEEIERYQGGIITFKGWHPASFGSTFYAYLRLNSQNEMLELREKKSFTGESYQEPASTGVYYLNRWDSFLKYSRLLLEREGHVNNEYYVSLIYNEVVNDGLKVLGFEAERFICWGTPEDVEQYQMWSEYFSKDVSKYFNIDITR